MNMTKKIIFVGPCGGGKIPSNGASVKNYHIVNALRNEGISYHLIDTEYWKKTPFVLLKLLFFVLFVRGTYIVSANNSSAYRVISILTLLRQKTVYWVIGGSIADWIESDKVRKSPYLHLKQILVEGKAMKNHFDKMGFSYVRYLPNFKPIHYVPVKHNFSGGKVHFVFLSRITRPKGCDLIFEASNQLQQLGYKERYDISFYGPIESNYKDAFYSLLNNDSNVEYKGFLDLRDQRNYDILSSYQIMLFPTFWHGEGFPGIVIDAYIAGLPIIASDWNLNTELIDNGKTGTIIPTHDLSALVEAMRKYIDHPKFIDSEACNSQLKSKSYSTEYLLNKSFFDSLI